MGNKSLTLNSIFYLGNQLLNILFPLFTGIYVARVLLPSSIGAVAYAQNIVQYFVIFSFLGLPTYGLREISRVRNNRDQLNRIHSELFIINFCSTLFFLLLYFLLIFSVEKFWSNYPLYLIVGLSIALNFLNISWVFEGLEEFRFVAIRNAVFKFICVILLIVFVRSEDDYLWFAAISVIGTAGNYIINMVVAPRVVTFTFQGLSFKRHIKPILYLVAVNLAIEIYTLVDVTMLGIMCNETNVAFYSYGSRMAKTLLTIVNSFTMVIVPRIVLYYKESKFNEFNLLLSKTLRLILLLSIPMIIGLQFVADDLVLLLYGQAYSNSATILRTLSLLLLISPVGYLLGSRVMLATNQESKMLISVSVGAVVNVIGNYLLIPKYAELGASIASVISEIVVMVIYVSFGWKYFKLVDISQSLRKILLAVACMVGTLFWINTLPLNLYSKLATEILVAIVVYFGVLMLSGEELVRGIIKNIFNRNGKI